MKKVLRIAIATLLSVAMGTLLVFHALSYDTYTYNHYSQLNNISLLSDYGQAYLVGTNRNTVSIDAVYPNSYNIELTLDENVYSYNLSNGILVLISPVESRDNTVITTYDIARDSIVAFTIKGCTHFENTQISYSNGYIYLADNSGNIVQYDTKGKLVNTFSPDGTPCYLLCNNSGDVYAASYSGLYTLSNSSCECIYPQDISPVCSFISDDMIVNSKNYIYSLKNNSWNTVFTDTVYNPHGYYDNKIISTCYNTIYAFDMNSGEPIRRLNLSADILELHTISDTIIALSYDAGTPTVSIIKYKELRKVKKDSDKNQTSNDSNSIKEISSDVYNVDYSSMTITDIHSPTTVAQFKKNMNYDGYNVEFFRYGEKELKSGNVGTATLVRFYNEYSCYEFELSVIGDVTGEGNVNSRDKDLLFDYNLDIITFTGVYQTSADLDYNGIINIKDLILLFELIENKK